MAKQSPGERFYSELRPDEYFAFFQGKPWSELSDGERAVWQAIVCFVAADIEVGDDAATEEA